MRFSALTAAKLHSSRFDPILAQRLFIERDSQSGTGWQRQEAVANRFERFARECPAHLAIGLGRGKRDFLDDEVGDRGGTMQSGGCRDGAAAVKWCNADVVRLCQRGRF